MGNLRITGMATGMDTDNTIKQMMKPYQMRFDKAKQDRQIVQWQQDIYRDILSDIGTFRNTYFDILKSDNYMLSKNSYAGFDITASNNISGETAGVSVTASAGAATGTYRVEVLQLAESAKLEGAINLSGAITDLNRSNWNGKTISFKVGNDQVDLTLNDPIPTGVPANNAADIADDINSKIAGTALSGKVVATIEGNKVRFNVLTNETVKLENAGGIAELSNMQGKVINNPNKYTTRLSDLGIAAGEKKFDLTYRDSTGVEVTKSISIDPTTTTIQGLIDKVSKETSGNVVFKYSELTGKFSLETLATGSSTALKVVDTDNILKALNLTSLDNATLNASGKDSEAIITPPGAGSVGMPVTKSGNVFSIDGINYTLSKAGTTNTVEIKANIQKSYDKIKAFIDKYNEMISKINKKIDEKKQYKYLPLTDEQREGMKEEEIKKWEDKAKEGLLRNDPMLQGMLYSLRSVFFEGVEGAGISLAEIGLDTSSDTSERGKIIINETKLKDALLSKGEQVANLFTKTSESFPRYNPDLTKDQMETRRKEEGIFQRVLDVLQDYTRTTRNNDGKKGIILEKAGIKGDYTEFKNLLTQDLAARDNKINTMQKSLADRENRYYKQFAQLEKAMNQMNAQSSWLAQQLGGGK